MLNSSNCSRWLLLAPFVCLLASPALAQTATATGTGVGVANSESKSGAVAVGNNVTVNGTPAVTTSNINQRVSGTQTVKSAPAFVAPGLTAAGLETCLGSISGGGSAVGFGASFGTTIPDPGCAARLDARTLWSMGLKGAAVARLCLTPEIYKSMPDICETYRPQQQPAGIVMSASATGAIEVIDGRTGATRLCDDYNATRQKCLQWNGEKRRVAAASPPKPRLTAPRPATSPPSATAPAAAASPAAAAEPKKEN